MSFIVFVAVFQFLCCRMHKFHIVSRAEFGGGRGTALQIAQGCLHKSCLSALSTVQHFQDQVRGTLINDYTSFANVSR